jgi:phage head maturation protease
MNIIGPRGWDRDQIITRFLNDARPSSYDRNAHTAECVISRGSPVVRFYGVENLRIDERSVDLSRMHNGSMIPLLDSHERAGIVNALGRFQDIWIERGALVGRMIFNQTPNGQLAEGMVERGEITGISAGYSVENWLITDEDGRIVDADRVDWCDENLTFEATRWALQEASLVSVPADSLAMIRSAASGRAGIVATDAEIAATRNRMRTRQRMVDRQAQMLGVDDDDED